MNKSNETLVDIDYCISDEYYDTYRQLVVPVYFVIAPVYVVFVTGGRFFLLSVIITDVKHHSGYGYQAMMVACETCTDVFAFVYLVLWEWLWYVQSYRRCWICMWFTFKLSILLVEASGLITALVSVAMSVDRVFALQRPIDYRLFNHKRSQIIVLTLSALGGVLVTVFDYFRYNIIIIIINDDDDDDTASYSYDLNLDFVQSGSASALTHLRDAVRLICLLTLVVCNIILVLSFRSLRKETANSLGKSDDAQRRANERTLILMTIVQCTTCIVSSVAFVVFYTIQYTITADRECPCAMEIAAVIYNLALYATQAANFGCCVGLNKRIRKLFCGAVRRTARSCLGVYCRKSIDENGSVVAPQ